MSEELLYTLCQTNDPNALLVAQDIAIEMNCGLPVIFNRATNGNSFNSIVKTFGNLLPWKTIVGIGQGSHAIMIISFSGKLKNSMARTGFFNSLAENNIYRHPLW